MGYIFMPTLIPETMLPNGMKVFYLRKNEVPTIYQAIQYYFKNGIELHEGDTIFDVGANIGLFTLSVHQLCNKNVSVYAFEPIPAIFEVLHRNAQRFGPDNLKVFPCGLSQESKSITFAYNPNATVLSTAYPDSSKQAQDKIKNAVLRNLKHAPASIRWLRWFPPFLRSLILDNKLEKTFQQIEPVTCQVRTVSEIISEYNIQQIDLLKIDAEKSELDVLLGIEERDWPKIKQVVAEVYDLNCRVEKITALLKEHGFGMITVEQDPIFKDSQIFNLYALRKKLE